MKPYREHVTTPRDASWVFFDRRLERFPFEWHYHPEYELTLTLNSRGQRFVGDNVSAYNHGDLVLIGPKIPHTWCSSERANQSRTHRALVLWFTEAFVKTMIEPHVELHPILRLLERSSRALTFSTATRETAQSAICSMLDQAPGATFVIPSQPAVTARGRQQDGLPGLRGKRSDKFSLRNRGENWPGDFLFA